MISSSTARQKNAGPLNESRGWPGKNKIKEGRMKKSMFLFFCMIFLLPLTSQAAVGFCSSDDGDITVSIITNDDGRLLDLAIVFDEKALIVRFPEANETSVKLQSYTYKFAAKKNTGHEALEIDISGKNGKMKYGGANYKLECNWQ
jgi:hypothetical protein